MRRLFLRIVLTTLLMPLATSRSETQAAHDHNAMARRADTDNVAATLRALFSAAAA